MDNEQNQVLTSSTQDGTFAIEELALEFAKWISLPLKREVNQVFMAYKYRNR